MWTIKLLGGLSAKSPCGEFANFRSQKAAALLACLVTRSIPQSRDFLVEMLWPDAEIDTGRHNLSNALSVLRSVFKDESSGPGSFIMANRSTVFIDPRAISIDVKMFEEAANSARKCEFSAEERLVCLRRAADLYAGPLLPGFKETWISLESLRLESIFLRSIAALVEILMTMEKPDEALSYAQSAVLADPLSEEATSRLMKVLLALSQPELALRAYRTLDRLLCLHLHISPSEHMQTFATALGRSAEYVSDVSDPDNQPFESNLAYTLLNSKRNDRTRFPQSRARTL